MMNILSVMILWVSNLDPMIRFNKASAVAPSPICSQDGALPLGSCWFGDGNTAVDRVTRSGAIHYLATKSGPLTFWIKCARREKRKSECPDCNLFILPGI